MSDEKPMLSKRKVKRQIKVKGNKIENVSLPNTKKPVGRKSKFYLFVCVMLLLNGIVYSSWLSNIFDKNSTAPKTLVENLPKQNNKAKNVLPDDFDLPPQNAPIDTGYNASSGRFPPGAMPQGVTLPYGSSYNPTIAQSSAGRSPMQGYSVNDGVRQQFTGYPRDAEIGLDYAQNRYYNPQHGRFTSVDPENYQARLDISNPQSWNAYAYVNNQPTRYTDPTGKCGTWKFWQCIGNKATYGRFKSNDEIQAEADRHRETFKNDLLEFNGQDVRGKDWNRVSNAEILGLYDGVIEAAKNGNVSIENSNNAVESQATPNLPQIEPPSISIPSPIGTTANQAPLKNLHNGTEKTSIDFWRKKSTDEIVDSLKPGKAESLRVKPDGTIMNGNQRIEILRKRGVNVDSLPREIYNP